jgi:hypothetical protein
MGDPLVRLVIAEGSQSNDFGARGVSAHARTAPLRPGAHAVPEAEGNMSKRFVAGAQTTRPGR